MTGLSRAVSCWCGMLRLFSWDLSAVTKPQPSWKESLSLLILTTFGPSQEWNTKTRPFFFFFFLNLHLQAAARPSSFKCAPEAWRSSRTLSSQLCIRVQIWGEIGAAPTKKGRIFEFSFLESLISSFSWTCRQCRWHPTSFPLAKRPLLYHWF